MDNSRYLKNAELHARHDSSGKAVAKLRETLRELAAKVDEGQPVEEDELKTMVTALRIRLEEYYSASVELEADYWIKLIVYGILTNDIEVAVFQKNDDEASPFQTID